MTLVSLDAIRTSRVVGDKVLVRNMASLLSETGQLEPILVRKNMILIDGLLRVEAAKELGWTELRAVVTDDIHEIGAELHRTHAHLPLVSDTRLFEFHQVLLSAMRDYQNELRRRGEWRTEARQPRDRRISYTRWTQHALGTPFPAYIERVSRLFTKAANGTDPLAEDLFKKVMAGEMSTNMAVGFLDSRNRLNGHVVGMREQRTLFKHGVRNLSGVIKGLKSLGSPIVLPEEELNPLITELEFLRSELYILARKIRIDIEKTRQKKEEAKGKK